MKLKTKKMLASRKNILIASTVGAVMLFGGVSAYYVNMDNQKANTTQFQQAEETPTPSVAPHDDNEPVITTEPSAAPAPSTSPEPEPSPAPEPITLDSLTIEQIETQSMAIEDCTKRAHVQFGNWSDEKWEQMIRTEIEKETGAKIYVNSNSNGSHYKHKACVYWYTKQELLK